MLAASTGVAMFPKIDWSTASGVIPDLAMASTAAERPRSAADTSLKSVPALRYGVLAPFRM